MSTSNVEMTVESTNNSCNHITLSLVKMSSSAKTTERAAARMRKEAKRKNVPRKKKRGYTPVKQCGYDKRNQQFLSQKYDQLLANVRCLQCPGFTVTPFPALSIFR